MDLESSPGWWASIVASSYILPKQDGGTSQIQVNPTHLSQRMDLPEAKAAEGGSHDMYDLETERHPRYVIATQPLNQDIDLLCTNHRSVVRLVAAERALVPVAEAVAVEDVPAPEGDHDPVRRTRFGS